MRKSVLIVAAFVALACASTALAGGWATVKLSSSPKGMTADEPWVVDITVLQHGLASQPLCCLKPTVTIRRVGVGALDERARQEVADLQSEADESLWRLPRARSCSRARAPGGTRSSTPSPNTAAPERTRSQR